VTGAAIAAALASRGLTLPDGHALLTLEECPDLTRAVERFGSSVWPEFMLHDAMSDRYWQRMAADFPGHQLALVDAAGEVVGVGRSMPLAWDGSLEDLPHGWDEQFERSIEQSRQGRLPDTLGAIMIVTHPHRRGDGLGSLLVWAMQEAGRLRCLKTLIACVRPTLLERYPLTPIDEYARWRRGDGLPFDPWIRIHVRAGGVLSRPEPASMRVSASVAEWEAWTGMAFPASGRYVVPGACAPVLVDREADTGTYLDPNVWVIHDLGG
jgi:GNAT superfamily N-acetyltransferase